MAPVWLDEGVLAWLEAESEEEAEFLKGCPEEWGWERVLEVWNAKG